MSEKISVVGLGKLGLPLAACFARRGFQTLGVDLDERVVQAVNSGRAPHFEPGLDALLAEFGGSRLRATTDHREAIVQSDVTMVLVATPSNPDGTFSNRYVEAALRSLAGALAQSDKPYHLFVISSTVVPGSTENSFIPLLEKHSGRRLNQGFGVCYDPDFVALGEVIHGFLRPELVVIGESDRRAGDQMEAIHRKLCENEPYIARMSLISAEVAKVSLNTYITMKISFANTLANLCEHLPGADVDEITRAIGVDKRISPHYLQGGLSFGGTCFPRDTKAFITISEKFGSSPELIRVVDQINQRQDEHLTELVLRQIGERKNATVGILGLAFKPNTTVIVESPALKLSGELLKRGHRVVAYDPLAAENARSVYREIEYVETVEACLGRVDLCVLTHRSQGLKTAVENYVPHRPLTVVDCWRLLDPRRLHPSIKHVALGKP
ncbi:MAG: UDP-glucose/GDP-mannose dehydrogenase family protein, partial [Calditrichaeota bacterium]